MIKDLKDLEKLLKLLRKQGVTDFQMDALHLKLGELPQSKSDVDQADTIDQEDPWANFPPGMLTPEQLAFYSAGGDPNGDPLKDKA